MHERPHHHTASDLVDEIFDMAVNDETLTDDARELVFTMLADRSPASLKASGDAETQPVRAFLKSIRVRGFRGIGPEALLELQPGPGLTVVCGRNGSGKSSFAEALELALTGNTYRWTKKSSVWAEHWRNLHDGNTAQIHIGIVEEGQGTTTVGVTWAQNEGLNDRTTWVQRPSAPRETGIASLGWGRAIELHRPLLSYDELGGLLEAGPSKLFDKIDPILGIEPATEVDKILAGRHSALKRPEEDAKVLAKQLKLDLSTLDDQRAQAALTELNKRKPDLGLVEDIATGTARDTHADLDGLRAAARLVDIDCRTVVDAAQALRSAATAYAQENADGTESAARRATLLQDALAHHDQVGEGSCPVCGEGHLDARWRKRVQDELDAEKEQNRRRITAQAELRQARKHAAEVVHAVPRPPDTAPFTIESHELATATWQTWSALPEDSDALATHMERLIDEVQGAIGLMRDEASALLEQHEDTWSAHATRLSSWLRLAREAQENKPAVTAIVAAREFMKRTIEELRRSRLARLERAARDVWSALKQESNVNLAGIELTGSATQRRVRLRADVDGTEAQAVGVMSQGELHALALALFLPRASLPGSPFQFVVLDDPIQAMDPAKVDSFVSILRDLAVERQVVVFSHDDRLPRAVRDMKVDARILQVNRDGQSAVSISACHDPASRAVENARALSKDPTIPSDVLRRVLPGLCRDAIEAAARQTFMSRRFDQGASRETVEHVWQDARRTRQRVALAVHNDKDAELKIWLEAKTWRRPAMDIATRQAHGHLKTDPEAAIHNVQQLVKDLLKDSR